MYSNCELEVGLHLLNKLDVLELNTVIHRNLAYKAHTLEYFVSLHCRAITCCTHINATFMPNPEEG